MVKESSTHILANRISTTAYLHVVLCRFLTHLKQLQEQAVCVYLSGHHTELNSAPVALLGVHPIRSLEKDTYTVIIVVRITRVSPQRVSLYQDCSPSLQQTWRRSL